MLTLSKESWYLHLHPTGPGQEWSPPQFARKCPVMADEQPLDGAMTLLLDRQHFKLQ